MLAGVYIRTQWEVTTGFYRRTNGLFVSPLVRTDNIYLPTENWLYHRFRQYRWTRLFGEEVYSAL